MRPVSVTLDPPIQALTTATLTLVPLNHQSLRTVTNWSDQHALHRAVMGMFPDNLPGNSAQRRAIAGILHRHDTPANGPARLLIQHATPLRPELTADPDLRHADLHSLLSNLRTGTEIRFRIVLNAVRSQTRPKKRVPITAPDDLIAWGLQHLMSGGLCQIELADQPATALGTSGNFALWTARYDGRARIANPDTTRHALLNGLGRAKAYGCGLLSLAPARI